MLASTPPLLAGTTKLAPLQLASLRYVSDFPVMELMLNLLPELAPHVRRDLDVANAVIPESVVSQKVS